MGKAKPVTLGSTTFKSEASARTFFQKMLRSYKPGERVRDEDAALLEHLLMRHPEAHGKIGEGIDHFEIMSHTFNSQCFAVHRTDGSYEDFSYKWCVTEG
jgi:hypothetical protein